MASPPSPAPSADPQRTLSVLDAVALIVGMVVGVGIFRAPSIVAANSGSVAVFFGLWIAGGVISLIGALCYAELGSAFPNAGGEYFYLRRAFGNALSFLFGWARITVIQTGAIAAVAFVLGDYATELLPLGPQSSSIYAALAVVAVTTLNFFGTTQSKSVQKILIVALGFAIAVIIAAGLSAPRETIGPAASDGVATAFSSLAMIFVLLTYGGWNEAAYLTAELRDSRRGIVRALVLGIVIITAVYLLLNLAFIKALGLSGLSGSTAVAADALRFTVGDASANVVGAIIMAAALSTLNASIFTGARTTYALGRDFATLEFLGRWNTRAMAPINSLLVQAMLVLLLIGLGSFTHDGFTAMVAYTAPAFWLFFLITGCALFVLRRQGPREAGTFRVPLYPLTPFLFCAVCLYMLYASVAYALSLRPDSIGATVGIGVLASGIPVYLFVRRRQNASKNGEVPAISRYLGRKERSHSIRSRQN